MRQLKSKLITLLLTLCCLFTGVGLCLTSITSAPAGVTVSADDYTEYAVGGLSVHMYSAYASTATKPAATAIYMKRLDSTTVTLPYASWDAKFVYESGTGWLLNGVSVTNKVGKLVSVQNNQLYASLADTGVTQGDLLTVGGTFVYDTARYTITDSTFIWNGIAWEQYVDEAEYEITEPGIFTFQSNGNSTVLDLKPVSVTVPSRNNYLTPRPGSELTVNGVVKQVIFRDYHGRLRIESVGTTAVPINEGDVVTVGGTFVSPDAKIKYVVEEHEFTWNGTAWVLSNAPTIEYTTYELGMLKFHSWTAANNFLYLRRLDGQSITAPSDGNTGWTAVFSWKDGIGITLNDQPITPSVKFPASMFIALGSAPEIGDELKVGGTFYNEGTAVQYIIAESHFAWDGSVWVATNTPVEYTTTEVGVLAVHSHSAGTTSNVPKATQLYMKPVSGSVSLPYASWDARFVYESGDGWQLNGVNITSSVGNLVSVNATQLYVDLKNANVQVGDVLTVSGTFVYEAEHAKYVIEESGFVWDGEIWEKVIKYGTMELDILKFIGNTSTLNNGEANILRLRPAVAPDPDMPATDFPLSFEDDSGVGFTVNGEQKSVTVRNRINSGKGYIYLQFLRVQAGDIVKFGGTFYNADQEIKYVVREQEFMWNGSAWIYFVSDDDLETYDVVTFAETNSSSRVFQMEGSGKIDKTGIKFTASAGNTTNSVAFRFSYQSSNTAGGALGIRLRGTAWQGFYFLIREGDIRFVNGGSSVRIQLKSNTVYNIEIGAIDMKDGENIFEYIKIDGVYRTSRITAKTTVYTDTTPTTYSTFVTNNISIYGTATYNEVSAKSTIFVPVDVEFAMEEGAAIRLANTSDKAGIRFTSRIKAEDLEALRAISGVKNVSYGTLVIPYDYLEDEQAPNLADFDYTENRILKIPSTITEVDEEGYIRYYGAMVKMYESNYGRLFAGRTYIEITFDDDTVWAVYPTFDVLDNVRSIRYIARNFQEDTAKYETLNEEQKTIVDAYAVVRPDEGDALTVTAPTGEVFPYADSVKAYLQAGAGADVRDYYERMNSQFAPVQIKWIYNGEGAKKFVIEYGTEADFSDALSVEADAMKRTVSVYNLYKAATYYVRVSAVSASGDVLNTATGEFTTTSLGPRFMNVDGLYNVRDLGGYVTTSGDTMVQGIAYRSGALTIPALPVNNGYPNEITEEGKAYMSEVMGIKTEIDFRSASEAGISLKQGSVIPGATLVYVTMGAYEDVLISNTAKYREFLSILADESNYPVLMHCTGGADRTGTVVFLLHALLGVSEVECIQGYELTSFSYYNLRDTQGSYKDEFDPFLARIDTYEGNTLQEKVESWALSIGVTQAQIDNIRAIFAGEVAVDAPELYNPNASSAFAAAPKGATVDIRLNMSQLLVKKDED